MRECIEGVLLQPLRIIPVAGGPVLHMVRSDSPFFSGFGEVYFSEAIPGHVKAWKLHTRQTQLFAVPAGRLRLVLYDDRPASSTRGTVKELCLGRPDDYCLLRIPPGIWYGFAALGSEKALLCNCADMPHDPTESRHCDPDSPEIPYAWNSVELCVQLPKTEEGNVCAS